jgi:NAD(P)H-nitrite reductase large subunit
MSENLEDDIIICRCEDIKLSEIRQSIGEGNLSTEEIKRSCRCGMGPCQGRTCMPLVAQELAKVTGKPLAEIALPTFRQPVATISLGALSGGGADE